jgi:prepilin-type N-terminal cleavage/methylation domain-containing protein
MNPQRLRGETGMTLVELLVALTIVGLISAALFGSFFFAVSSGASSAQRVSDSAGAQLTSSLFVADAQSSDNVRSSGSKCGGSNTIVEFDETDADSSVTTVRAVDYDVVAAAIDNKLLRRQYLVTGGTCTLESTATLLNSAVALGDPTNPPKVDCLPTPCGSTTRSVTLTVTALSTNKSLKKSNYASYTFQSVGTRRIAP